METRNRNDSRKCLTPHDRKGLKMNYRESCTRNRLEYITYYITLIFMPKKKTAIVLTEEQQTKLKRFDDPTYVRRRFSEIGEMPTLPKAVYKK
jgi:hypothetical protein